LPWFYLVRISFGVYKHLVELQKCRMQKARKENEVQALLPEQCINNISAFQEVWCRVTDAVNAISTVTRDKEEVRKKWNDLKSSMLKELASSKKTGGGGPPKNRSTTAFTWQYSVVHGIDGTGT